jgi:hypothetical protein
LKIGKPFNDSLETCPNYQPLLARGFLLMRQSGFGVFLRAFHFSLFVVVRSVLS